MKEPVMPKIEKGIKSREKKDIKPEEGWVVGHEEEFKISDELRKGIKKGEALEAGKRPERPKRHSRAEEGKTPEELEKELKEEIEKVRGDVNRMHATEEFQKEKPKNEEGKRVEEKKKKEIIETIKKAVISEIPEKYKKRIGDLIGRDDEKALEIIDRIPVLKHRAMAFAGSASPESRLFAEDNMENREMRPFAIYPLMGDNTPHAWEIREELEFDREVDKEGIVRKEKVRGGNWWKLIEKTGLHKSKNFEKLIDTVNSSMPWPGWFMAPSDILKSTIGIRLNESPKKAKVIEKYGKSAPLAALECLTGDSSPQAKEKAAEICGNDPRLKDAHTAYLKSVEPGVAI